MLLLSSSPASPSVPILPALSLRLLLSRALSLRLRLSRALSLLISCAPVSLSHFQFNNGKREWTDEYRAHRSSLIAHRSMLKLIAHRSMPKLLARARCGNDMLIDDMFIDDMFINHMFINHMFINHMFINHLSLPQSDVLTFVCVCVCVYVCVGGCPVLLLSHPSSARSTRTYTLYPEPQTPNPKPIPYTQNPTPQTLNPKPIPRTPNPKPIPYTQNPTPQTQPHLQVLVARELLENLFRRRAYEHEG